MSHPLTGHTTRGVQKHDLGHCICKSHVNRPWNRPEHWSASEVGYLERWYGRRSDEAIARHLGRTVVGLRLKAKRIGIHKRDAGLSARDVARMFGVEDGTVAKVWIRRGLLKAQRGHLTGFGSRIWLIDEADIERFIRDHGYMLDADKIPADSPYRVERWLGLPELTERTGHGKTWLAAFLRSGAIPSARRGAHWYVRASDVPKIPHREPAAVEVTRYLRREELRRRRDRRAA